MDAAAWVAIAAAAISLASIVPAKQQVSSMKEQTRIQEEQTRLQAEIQKDSLRPYVWLDYRLNKRNGFLIELVLKNEGPSIAKNIRIECSPAITRTSEFRSHSSFGGIGLFERGITSMPPGREMSWTLGGHVKLFEEKAFSRHHISIFFDGPFGPETPIEYVLDYADAEGQTVPKEGSLARVEDEIKKLGGSNGALTKIHGALRNLAPRDPDRD